MITCDDTCSNLSSLPDCDKKLYIPYQNCAVNEPIVSNISTKENLFVQIKTKTKSCDEKSSSTDFFGTYPNFENSYSSFNKSFDPTDKNFESTQELTNNSNKK